MRNSANEQVEVLGATFALVVFLEILALAICYVPLSGKAEQWQRDAALVGWRTAAVAAIVVLLVFFSRFAPVLAQKVKRSKAEHFAFRGGVLLIFLANIVSLTVVISRTGGALESPYAPLFLIQLGLMGLIQAQTELILKTTPRIWTPMLYAAVSCAFLYVIYFHGNWVLSVLSLASDYSHGDEQERWHFYLTASGLVLGFIGNWSPRHEGFLRRLGERLAETSENA